MPPHLVPRLRIAALCLAFACRSALYVIISFVVIKSAQGGSYSDYLPNVLAAWLGICSVPALLLAPLIGALAASRLNKVILVTGAFIMLGLVGWASSVRDVPWLSVAGVLSLEAAFFVAAALALIAPQADAAKVRAVTVRWFVVLCSMVGSFAALFVVNPQSGHQPADWFTVGFAALSFLAIFCVPRALATPISLKDGFIKPFIAGVRDSLRHRRAWTALGGLWIWFFMFLTIVVVLLRVETLAPRTNAEGLGIHGPEGRLWETTWWFGVALVIGVVLSCASPHPFRHGGFAFFAAFMALGACVWLRFSDSPSGPLWLVGISLGLAVSPLLNAYQTWTSSRFHGIGGGLLVAGLGAAAVLAAIVIGALGSHAANVRDPLLNLLIIFSAVAAAGSTIAFLRPAVESTAAFLLWPIYRMHAYGPGVERLPSRGPCLVIGNHAAWFDPLFLAKILPAPTTPMMTSKFYDLPVLSWLMRHVIGTIRVPDVPLRHEAPELKEAVAALDRNECVVLFPEGYLRRKEEVPLRRFGRGVWKILVDRPETPVFACWVEGNWGSFFSHRGGPPTKGKRFDFWRQIRIGIIGPIKLEPALLADHMATRMYLMQQVAAARAPLGLESIDLQLSTAEEETE